MTGNAIHRRQADELLHDEWWGDTAQASRAASSAVRPARDTRSPWLRLLAGACALPMRVLARTRVNRRFRRFALSIAIALAVLVALVFAGGVIMLNNIVIERSSELGTLDAKRRELRSENALISAELAALSAPPRIGRLARTRLGMTLTQMPRFIYLDQGNRPMTPARRRQIARRLARERNQALQQGGNAALATGVTGRDTAAAEAAAFAAQAAAHDQKVNP